MFIGLSDRCFLSVPIFVLLTQDVLHLFSKVFCLFYLKTFANNFVKSIVGIETHSGMIIFIAEKKASFVDEQTLLLSTNSVIGLHFLIILHVIAIRFQMQFQILGNSFNLFINFEMVNCRKVNLNSELFIKNVPKHGNELRFFV